MSAVTWFLLICISAHINNEDYDFLLSFFSATGLRWRFAQPLAANAMWRLWLCERAYAEPLWASRKVQPARERTGNLRGGRKRLCYVAQNSFPCVAQEGGTRRRSSSLEVDACCWRKDSWKLQGKKTPAKFCEKIQCQREIELCAFP